MKLGCGHVFHINCLKTILENKWTSPRIVFGFMNCPSCKQPMELDHCGPLRPALAAVKAIRDVVEAKAVERAKFEGLDKDPRLKNPADHYYGKLKDFALFKMSYYMCFKCK